MHKKKRSECFLLYDVFMPQQTQISLILVLGFVAACYVSAYIHPLASLLVVVIAGYLAWALLKRKPSSATAAALSQRLSSVRVMSGTQFEHFVADVMRGLGYRAQVLGGSGDQGVDVIATGRGERLAIQCKQHAKPVSNKPVQEVFAGSKHHGCTKAMVVAPMGYTKGAFSLARSVGVDLYDTSSLRGWIWQIERREKAQANERDQANERTQGDLEPRTVDLDERDRGERNQTNSAPRIVDLDGKSSEQKENRMTESGMEKHTISVGTDTTGETVTFTAKRLGKAELNGGKEASNEDGMDWTFYRLPDHTYRVLIERGSTSMLEPSNIAQALRSGEPIEYGRFALEELQNHSEYGRVFAKVMEQHPEGKKRNVRDLD